MTVAASYDPLYPLVASYHVSPDIVELVEIDLYQYLMCTKGKTAIFGLLQRRLLKVKTAKIAAF